MVHYPLLRRLWAPFGAILLLGFFCAAHGQLEVPMKKADRPQMEPPPALPKITHIVYLDVQIEETSASLGRIVLGLFGQVAPKTVENFYRLCLCDQGLGKYSGKPLCYRQSYFHRIIPNFMVQGGDITHSGGTGGESIYGGKFDDESFQIRHNKKYLLSMANAGRNNNGSQFFINTVKTSWLDGKNVAFGMVLQGFQVVDELEALGTNSGTPRATVTIVDCGALPMETLASITTHTT
jgi:peptidylprolyl isomerase